MVVQTGEKRHALIVGIVAAIFALVIIVPLWVGAIFLTEINSFVHYGTSNNWVYIITGVGIVIEYLIGRFFYLRALRKAKR